MISVLELAKEILAANPKASLSGSLALNLQNIKTRREPTDLDFYLPLGIDPLEIKGMTVDNFSEEQAAQYENEFYELLPYQYRAENEDIIRVDFFRPIDQYVPPLISETSKYGIRVVRFSEIIKMKIEHAYGKHYSKFKHKDDIAFMMSNIS